MISPRTRKLSFALVLATLLLPLALYDRMPAQVPTHWDSSGHVDRFMSKPWGALVMPLTTALVFVVLSVLPRISPRGFRMDRFAVAYDTIVLSVVGFLAFTSTLVTLQQVGLPVPMDRAIRSGVGVLFIVLGNLLGKVQKNFFVGVRTPWTLASDEVWLRTNRLGGKLFVLAGFVVFVSALFVDQGTALILGAVGVAALVPVAYSYWLYRRLEGQGHEG